MDFTRFKYGCELILWGFFKKLVIADRAVIAINTVVSDYNSCDGTTLTFAVLLYALQLYADFSGGIDISRGISQILGIDMVENFRRPYFSKSISEYWRRWHITLGAWMKEYIFYPLSISKLFLSVSKKMKKTKLGTTKAGSHISKVLPTAFASLVVFLVVGVWHGASWKYVAFGLWNGGIIMLSILCKPLTDGALRRLRINPERFLWKLFQMLRTFLIVCIGYVFDIAPSFKQAMWTFKMCIIRQDTSRINAMLHELGLLTVDYCILFAALIVLIIVGVIQEQTGERIRTIIDRKNYLFEVCIIAAGLLITIFLGVYYPGYDAASFVYAQF